MLSIGTVGGQEDYAAVAARLNLLLAKPTITGREIRELVFNVRGQPSLMQALMALIRDRYCLADTACDKRRCKASVVACLPQK